jgi:hypothetical protein
MSTVAVSQVVPASAVDLWRILVDLPRRGDWLTTVGEVELLTPGPLAVGTAWRELRTRPDGRVQAEEFVVREAVPPRRLVLVSPGSGASYRTTYVLRPVHRRRRRGTAVLLRQEAAHADPVGRLLALLLGGLAARTVEGTLRRDLADLSRAAADTHGITRVA